jgi:hypothetical protein
MKNNNVNVKKSVKQVSHKGTTTKGVHVCQMISLDFE